MKLYRLIIILCAGVLLLAACRNESPTETDEEPTDFWGTSSPEAQSMDSSLLALASGEADALAFVKSFLIVRNDTIVLENYFLRHERAVGSSLQSVTKSLVSAVVGIGLDNGDIDSLDQAIMDFFPDYATAGLDTKKYAITLHHLLTMTGGFDSDQNVSALFYGASNWIQKAIELPLISEPGESFHYNSYAAHLLSGAVTRISGSSTMDYASTWLFEKIGVSVDRWDRDPQNICYGGGGLYISGREMARFALLYLHGGRLWDRQIVSAGWVELSLTRHVDGLGDFGVLSKLGYGYLWWLGEMSGCQLAIAWGYGGQFIILVPEKKLIIVTQCTIPAGAVDASIQEAAILKLVDDYVLPSVKD